MRQPPPAPLPLPARTGITSSSPGRVEKLPTPGLARLLRRKGGTRNSGRSSLPRSSPLFSSRTKRRSCPAASVNVGDEGEPSSPKVTCFGQVRIRPKKKAPSCGAFGSNTGKGKWVKGWKIRYLCLTILCSACLRRRKPTAETGGRCRRTIWWRLFNRNGGYQRSREPIEPPETESDPPPCPTPLMALRMGSINIVLQREDDGGAENERKTSLPYPSPLSSFEKRRTFKPETEEDGKEAEDENPPTTPPKNALILMRCRSTLHNRSSSLTTVPFVAVCEEHDSCKETEYGKATRRSGGEDCNEDSSRCPLSQPLFLERSKSEPAKKAASTDCSPNRGGGNRCRR